MISVTAVEARKAAHKAAQIAQQQQQRHHGADGAPRAATVVRNGDPGTHVLPHRGSTAQRIQPECRIDPLALSIEDGRPAVGERPDQPLQTLPQIHRPRAMTGASAPAPGRPRNGSRRSRAPHPRPRWSARRRGRSPAAASSPSVVACPVTKWSGGGGAVRPSSRASTRRTMPIHDIVDVGEVESVPAPQTRIGAPSATARANAGTTRSGWSSTRP